MGGGGEKPCISGAASCAGLHHLLRGAACKPPNSGITTPIVQTEKLRLRDVKWLAQKPLLAAGRAGLWSRSSCILELEGQLMGQRS